LAVVLLGLVAALFLWPEKVSTPVQANELRDPIVVADLAETATVDPARETSQVSPASERVELATTDSEVDVSPSAFEPQYEGEGGFTLRVLDAITRKPIPGADVYIKDQTEFYRQLRQLPRNSPERTLVNLLPLIGKHYQANAAGEVRLAALTEVSLAMATKGDFLGLEDWIRVKPDAANILMRVNRPFTINVVQADGEPVAGAPVTVQSEVEFFASTRAYRHTNAQGSASFGGLCTMIDSSRGVQTFFARLEVPVLLTAQTEMQRVNVTDQIFEAGIVTLSMPPTGGVRISILDPEGNPSTESGIVNLNLEERENGPPGGISPTVEVVNGVAEFPYVGLGTSLTAEYRPQNVSNSDSISFPGPAEAGVWIETSITLTDWPTFTGVLLNPEGDPLSELDFDLKIKYRYQDGDYQDGVRFRTDEQGYFRCEIPQAFPSRILLSQQVVFSAEYGQFGECEATLDLPPKPQPGENPLGEIQLQATPVLLAGRVLDMENNPIHGAELMIYCSPPRSSGLMNLGRNQKFRAQCNAEGNFVIQGKVEENSSSFVTVNATGYNSFRQDISLGQVDVDFHLGKAGVLLGSILLDEGIDSAKLSISMKRRLQQDTIRLSPTAKPNLFQFRYEGNCDTPYVFRVDENSLVSILNGEGLFVLEGVLLPQGGEIRPPELQPLDLRGRIKQYKFIVQDREGQRIDATLSLKSERGSSSTSINRGAATLISSVPITEIAVSAPGFISQTIVDPGPEQTITLEKAMKAEVQLPTQYLHYRGMEIDLQVKSEQNQTLLRTGPFDSTGHTDLYFPAPGSYQFSLRVSKMEGNFGTSKSLNIGDIDLEHAGQVIELSVDQTALDQIVDKLNRQL
jgi:hypothetical protein